jgi:hypothetical protein
MSTQPFSFDKFLYEFMENLRSRDLIIDWVFKIIDGKLTLQVEMYKFVEDNQNALTKLKITRACKQYAPRTVTIHYK